MSDKLTVHKSVRRLEDLMGKCFTGHATASYEDGEAIATVLQELRAAIDCPSCDGRGSRWYSITGEGTCEKCMGSGKRQIHEF